MTQKSKRNLNAFEALSKKIFLNLLNLLQYGTIQVHDGDEQHVFGNTQALNEHRVTITITDPRAYKTIVLGGSVGAGKSYIEGYWYSDDLQKLIALFIKNESLFTKIESPFARCLSWVRTVSYKLNLNTVRRAKDNILAHYDLGNDFFRLMLDPSMMYSCALYEPPGISLEEAAEKKIQRICDRLALKPGDHVLEIGTGWGGFAIYAVQTYGCTITTTTISDKQYAYVKDKIKQLGLENQITLLNQDYRKLEGQYDKLVSIEMIEAVGHKYIGAFFNKCNQLLKPGGLFFLQSIVINDQAYEAAKNEVDFIKKYIFPGGCLPSIYSLSNAVSSQTSMQLLSLEDIGKHYVVTLNDWHSKLIATKSEIMAQGFNESFLRMWQFYFCYCAAGFESHYISNIHALWRKRK